MGFSRQEHWSGLPFPSPMHESGKWKWSRSVVSYSSRPHGLQPTRLLHPWDFPGNSTGVGCHCLLHSGAYYVPNPEWDTSWAFPTLKAYNSLKNDFWQTHSSLSVYSFFLSISLVLNWPITSPCNRFLSHFPWALTPCTRLLSPSPWQIPTFLGHTYFVGDWIIPEKWKLLSCVQLFVTPWTVYSPWNSPGQNTGVGSLSLLQGIFPTQESNQDLLHYRLILYLLSYQGRFQKEG